MNPDEERAALEERRVSNSTPTAELQARAAGLVY